MVDQRSSDRHERSLRTLDDTAPPPESVALAPGYVEVEHLLSGLASSYHGPADGPATPTGEQHRYVTRLVVRQPRDPAARSGRVVVEPFNTSNGADSDVIWSRVGSLLQGAGDSWVGVSVRTSSADRLVRLDPTRYGEVDIPTNDVAWDVLRHVGALLKDGGVHSPVDPRPADHVYLCGYSQSACDVATFAMGLHPMTRLDDGSPVYDGYFPAAHSANLTPLCSGPVDLPRFDRAVLTPVDVPVIDLETQCDVEGFRAQLRSGAMHTNPGGATVRRPDSDAPADRYRLYEVPGAPHSDWAPGCDSAGSTFPASAFLRAALRRLFEWAEDGVAPPRSPRIELSTFDAVSVAAVDRHGNALGGVRSPFVDVPISRYEVHSTGNARCLLVGRETPLPTEVLAQLYVDAADYVERFTERLDATIAAGFLLEADRSDLLAGQVARASAMFP